MTGILLMMAVVGVLRLIMGPLRLPRRRRPFRLGTAWYAVDAPGRHRVAPDPGRDWVVA